MEEINILIPKNLEVNEADELREHLNDLITKGERHFALDFSNCTFIDSTGLGVIVSIYKKCNDLNGKLRIHSVNSSQVSKVFKLTRLDQVFGI